MRGWGKAAWVALGVLGLWVAGSGGALANTCDEADPRGPAQNARIVLTAADAVEENGATLSTFVETGSLGRVDAALVSTARGGAVRSFFAAPHVSRYSRLYGEQLKGVVITVELLDGRRPGAVVVDLRQVCAHYFRDSFLYQ